MIGNILGAIVYGGFGLGTLITAFNVTSSNSRIKRKGNIIKPITTNSITENIKYFFKDYAFLLVPILNVVKSIKDMIKKDATYDAERLAKLQDRDRIEVVKKPEPVKVAPVPVKKEEDDDLDEDDELDEEYDEDLEEDRVVRPVKKTAPVKRTAPVKKAPAIKTVETMNCYERREYYRNQYLRLVDLHTRSKKAGMSVVELNKITAKIKRIVELHAIAQSECKIEDLKARKHEVIATLGYSRKLTK